jgi:hypothetical protein
MTPLCRSQQSQWLCCARHSGVNNSAVPVTAVLITQLNFFFKFALCTAESMTPLCMSQRCQWLSWNIFKICIAAQWNHWLHCASHRGVNDSAVQVTAKSMTPLCMSQRSHWLNCDKSRRLQSRFSRRILIHVEKGFNPCLRGLRGVVWWKKPEVENLVSGSLYIETSRPKQFWVSQQQDTVFGHNLTTKSTFFCTSYKTLKYLHQKKLLLWKR